MTPDETFKLADHLEKLAAGTIEPVNPRLGICGELGLLIPLSRNSYHAFSKLDLVMDLVVDWPKYSGSLAFPVPHPAYNRPVDAFYNPDYSKWDTDTEYGRNRRELCGWLAEELRKHAHD